MQLCGLVGVGVLCLLRRMRYTGQVTNFWIWWADWALLRDRGIADKGCALVIANLVSW